MPYNQEAQPAPRNGGGAVGLDLCPRPAKADAPTGEQVDGFRPITLVQPRRIFFGNGCRKAFLEHLAGLGLKRLMLVSSSAVLAAGGEFLEELRTVAPQLTVYGQVDTEPSLGMLERCLAAARGQDLDGVIGLGGGSAMDLAKLVAALADGRQTVREVLGANLLERRALFLACLPTTSGTGSEASPNAILFDEATHTKQAAISPWLVPDVACVDPELTRSAPPGLTAATGLDALTHCLEAYANRFAHPAVDVYAREGMRLIAGHLTAAVENGSNLEARARVALGSLYGGMCLGPVNTAAVHALAYPLASEFAVGHGMSIAVLLPHVVRFSLPAAPQRYAEIALALGARAADSAAQTAARAPEALSRLLSQCPVPQRLSELGIPAAALPRLAQSAMSVTRLLKNNPRPVTEADALAIYRAAF